MNAQLQIENETRPPIEPLGCHPVPDGPMGRMKGIVDYIKRDGSRQSRVFQWSDCARFYYVLSEIRCAWDGELGALQWEVMHGRKTIAETAGLRPAIESRAQRRIAAAELEFPSEKSEWADKIRRHGARIV